MATGREAGEAAPWEEEEQREWADLTSVCLAEAFSRLGLEDLWRGAMACCRSWRAAARSRPALFVVLDLRPAFEAVSAALLDAALDPTMHTVSLATTRRPGSPPGRRVGGSVRGGGAEGEEGGDGAEHTAEKLQSLASPDDEFENEGHGGTGPPRGGLQEGAGLGALQAVAGEPAGGEGPACPREAQPPPDPHPGGGHVRAARGIPQVQGRHHGRENPSQGIFFARGPAVAVLILLQSKGQTYVVLTEQARVPIGKFILELPAGMLDDENGDFVGTAVREESDEFHKLSGSSYSCCAGKLHPVQLKVGMSIDPKLFQRCFCQTSQQSL
ncbi:uncharacterized protein [Triticum aestivum]|uniref:uncharacterized protein isoform X2 n=1 Tax=Triticum aestivum TaxID=4565 RepID=UPI001D01F8D4|nr:uncharacterized protein LOC123156455 isoform X2 [Triticum aestivum]